jgi:hypothetical protein
MTFLERHLSAVCVFVWCAAFTAGAVCCSVSCVLVRVSRMQQQLRVPQSPRQILEAVHTVERCLTVIASPLWLIGHRAFSAVWYAFTF